MLQQRKCVDSQKVCHNVLFSITPSAICEYLRSEYAYEIIDGEKIDAHTILLADFMSQSTSAKQMPLTKCDIFFNIQTIFFKVTDKI